MLSNVTEKNMTCNKDLIGLKNTGLVGRIKEDYFILKSNRNKSKTEKK